MSTKVTPRVNTALFLRATETPLDEYGRPCGREEVIADDLPNDFKFSDTDDFFKKLEDRVGIVREGYEVEVVADEPGVVRLSYPSDGDCMYEKDEPVAIESLYYRIMSPAEDWKLAQLLAGGDCSNLSLRMEHLYKIVCPLEGDGEEEVVADDKDMAESDRSEICNLEEAKRYADFGVFSGIAASVKAVPFEGDPGGLIFVFHGTETGDTSVGKPTHSCSLFVRIMSPVCVDKLYEWFPKVD